GGGARTSDGAQLMRQRARAGEAIDDVEPAAQAGMRLILRRPALPRDPLAFRHGGLALGIGLEAIAFAQIQFETDQPGEPAAEEVLGAQAHHRVGALLQVAAADVDVDDGSDGAVICDGSAVMERDRAVLRLQRQMTEAFGEAAGLDSNANEAIRNRNAVGNGSTGIA